MGKKKQTWREKRDNPEHDLPKVSPIEGKMRAKWGDGTVVIPHPQEVDALMKKVRKGKVTTVNDIRDVLSKRHKTTMACPFTTGIFAWIASYAAEEDRDDGKKRITPWWRTLKKGGVLNEKYPGGIERQRELLEAEGHTIEERGRKKKTYAVKDLESKRMRFPEDA